MNKKTIWITGASSGIGRALALKFAGEGWEVAASSRRLTLLKELSVLNDNIHPFELDVTNIEMCKNVFDQILKKLKKIDVSIFSTGIHDPESEKNFNLSKIREIMEVNYFGTINSINSVYEYFKEKKSGHISIISSVAGYRGLPAAGGYCSSKAALTTYAESLFFDLQRYNVRVSVVSPGFIKTPMTDKNSFKMPMLKSVDFAAEEIFKGLTKSNSFEIHFPKTFTIIMKIVKCLPDFIYFKISKFGMKYIGR